MIYNYRDYKKYLLDLIEGDGSGGRGVRKRLAESVGCQVSHVTNVLSGTGHLSQEQAEATARFFGLDYHETEFFLLLVQYERAGTTTLKAFYDKVLLERQEKHTALKNRLKIPDSLGSQEEARYYSSWQYGAVHVLLSIPECQTRDAIVEKLGLPIARVSEILSFLVDTGLCRKEDQRYHIVRSLLHLDQGSMLISKHHTNWRLRAIQSFDQEKDGDLHYSSVFTLSKKDYGRVREVLAKALSESLTLIKSSLEEDTAVICVDLFHL